MSVSNILSQLAPTVRWGDMGETEHFVQFYEHEAALLTAVNGYVAHGLARGACAIVIATGKHLDELERQWQAQGLDLASAREQAQYLSFDAAETLAKLLLDDWPQSKRFSDVVGSVIAQAASRHAPVIAFGEMVALLWEDGKQSAAIHLEELWNELQKKHRFSLFCAYPMSECAEEKH